MPEQDPIKKIEEEKSLKDFGKMAYLVYQGAIEEGASPRDAFFVTAAYFRGMVGGSLDSPDEDENKEDED